MKNNNFLILALNIFFLVSCDNNETNTHDDNRSNDLKIDNKKEMREIYQDDIDKVIKGISDSIEKSQASLTEVTRKINLSSIKLANEKGFNPYLIPDPKLYLKFELGSIKNNEKDLLYKRSIGIVSVILSDQTLISCTFDDIYYDNINHRSDRVNAVLGKVYETPPRYGLKKYNSIDYALEICKQEINKELAKENSDYKTLTEEQKSKIKKNKTVETETNYEKESNSKKEGHTDNSKGTVESNSSNNFSPLAISSLNTLFSKSDPSGTVKILNNKSATIWFEQEFNLNGGYYHVVFVYESQLDEKGEVFGVNGVHVPVNVVTYKKDENNKWQLLTVQKNVANSDDGIGNYANAGYGGAESIIFNNKLFFLIEDSEKWATEINGYVYWRIYKDIFLYVDNIWSYAGKVTTSETDKDYIFEGTETPLWTYKGTVSLMEKDSNPFPYLTVKKTGTELNEDETKVITAKMRIKS
jgi:hypothetical protein